ncbi:GABA permease GabA [Metarhizium acridum CQMa 102]|uniref:GABA permease GabA n=1 Tax=Metarhizium acridum (strain CQMa 102) TaxID=655827 RepID=E9DR42_METAQ|nr:GABA permease GabA [Metarhizium acridum CQMa 102]EFY93720.1 GABA permease GabA [Metarhizium acridum CQMa 102]
MQVWSRPEYATCALQPLWPSFCPPIRRLGDSIIGWLYLGLNGFLYCRASPAGSMSQDGLIESVPDCPGSYKRFIVQPVDCGNRFRSSSGPDEPADSNTTQDAVAHMIEEIPHAASEGPKIMVVCVGIGTLTGAIFLIVLLFVSGNIDDVIGSSAGPLLQILIHATKSNAGAICSLSKRSTSRHGTDLCSSFPGYRCRMIFAFASAFNAIISASVVALDLSVAMLCRTESGSYQGGSDRLLTAFHFHTSHLPRNRFYSLPDFL